MLASSNVKRLAAEEGLDLTRLLQAGHPQPYHVSDLAVLCNLPGDAPAAGVPQIASHQITAQVPVDGLAAFLVRMSKEGGIELPASAVLCNFAAAAWRNVVEEGSFVLGLARIGQPDNHLIDPDRYRLPEFAHLITLENGKAKADAMGEATYAAEFFRWFAEEAVRADGMITHAPASGARRLFHRLHWGWPQALAFRRR